MARKGGSKSGKLALALALACGGTGLLSGFAGSLAVLLQSEGGSEKIRLAALVVPFVVGAIGGMVGWFLGGRIAGRLTDLALAVRAEGRLTPDHRLDPGRFAQLVVQCRRAKEVLLGEAQKEVGEIEERDRPAGDGRSHLGGKGRAVCHDPIGDAGSGRRAVR